jgi:hypothetical protein
LVRLPNSESASSTKSTALACSASGTASADPTATVLRMDEVEVRRSPRARRWRLEVPWGQPARLTAPRSMSQVEVEQVFREQRAWIEEQRRRQVPRLGLERLAVNESEAARTGVRELVSTVADEEVERLGVAYRRIRIGGQRTLWGSCSPGGTLSFNWRLVLAPLRGARLRGRARALPLALPRPLEAFLGARRGAPPALARAARLAARARARAACLQSVRVTLTTRRPD